MNGIGAKLLGKSPGRGSIENESSRLKMPDALVAHGHHCDRNPAHVYRANLRLE